MKHTHFTCNHCKKEYADDSTLICIGCEKDQHTLMYWNPFTKLNQRIRLENYSILHFCNQDCFINFFFDAEKI